MKYFSIILCGWLLAGCASYRIAHEPTPPALLADAEFRPATETITADNLFKLSPEMQAVVDSEIQKGGHRPQRRLYNVLFASGKLLLEYDGTHTRTPAETFAKRSGNCLSLVLLTAAFAKELNLGVIYHNVLVDETWSRSGTLAIAAHHVNITIGRPRTDFMRNAKVMYGEDDPFDADSMTIDFLPPEDASRLRSLNIDENTIVAMYMNNRAAEALLEGNIDNAYWWARKALTQFPDYLNSYNTLAVIYSRHGDNARAEATLRYALQSDPSDVKLLGNLVPVLTSLGKLDEAAQVRQRVALLDPHPAFEYFDRGMAAVQRGAWSEARDQFAREVRRAPYNAEFHYWLAVAAARLGELDTAREEMDLAAQNATSQKDNALYTGKLAQLRRASLR